MTSISVAMTTFNGEQFLSEQLESLSRQTRRPNELVVVDDGSRDWTHAILRKFAENAPFPVRTYSNDQRLGWRANFFKAAQLCKSELIAFCDQDDLWYPNKLQTIEHSFLDPNLLLVHHEADLIDEAGIKYGKLRDGEKDRAHVRRLGKPTIWSHAPGLTIVFRRTLLSFTPYWPMSIDPGAPDKAAAHDQWIYHLASNLGNIRFIAAPLVGYRQHSSNQVGFRSNRHHALSSPTALKEEIIIQERMLTAFISALQNALLDQNTGFDDRLPSAIAANQALQHRLQLRNALYRQPNAFRRLVIMLKLLKNGSYMRSTHWNLGRRSLVADLRAVMRQPG